MLWRSNQKPELWYKTSQTLATAWHKFTHYFELCMYLFGSQLCIVILVQSTQHQELQMYTGTLARNSAIQFELLSFYSVISS